MTKSKSLLFLIAIFIPATLLVMGVWIGGLLLFAHFGRFPDAKGVFNDIIMLLCVLVLLPLLHRGMYRTFWDADQRQRLGQPPLRGTYLDGNQPLPAAPPSTVRTSGQTAGYVACYLLGVPVLLWTFVPLDHAGALTRFIARHSSGSASAGSLLTILVAYLPMVVLLLPLMFLLRNDRQAIVSGTLPAAVELRLRLKMNWLFSFVAAFIGTAILCQMTSSLVLRLL